MRRINVEQGSYEWHCERQGKVTGTTLKSAIGAAKVQETLLYKLIAERMTEPQITDINSSAVSRGREMEPIARRAVITETGLDFVEIGMLASDEIEGYAVSPDAIFEENGEIVGGLEIKCPDSKKHIEYAIKGELPKDYLEQIEAPFLVSEKVKWWYFASFDDRNYERPLFLLKVERASFKTLDSDKAKLTAFLKLVDQKHMEITF